MTRLRLSRVEDVAALSSLRVARLIGAIPPETPDGLVQFELEGDQRASDDALAAFAAGSLTGSLREFADEERRVRQMLREARRVR